MKLKLLSSNIKRTAFTLVALTTTALSQAEEPVKHPAKPFLWKVEGKQLKKPAYLFGTIHLGDPAVSTLHPTAQAAFDKADNVYTEVNLSPESQMALTPLLIRDDSKTLDESIGKELSDKFNAELKLINPHLDSVPFQTLKTWVSITVLEQLPGQLKGLKSLDLQLWKNAKATGKKTAGLEDPKEQLKAFNTLNEEEQIIFFSESLKYKKKNRAEGKNEMELMKNAYITGEIDEVNNVINAAIIEMRKGEHKELAQKIWQQLLVDRDVTISNSIIEAIKKDPKKTHFFAVGTAHYCTDTSILYHLKKAGYTITRIEK